MPTIADVLADLSSLRARAVAMGVPPVVGPGAAVKVTSSPDAKVRATPSSAAPGIGFQTFGTLGAIPAGIALASGYWWVNFSSAPSGYVWAANIGPADPALNTTALVAQIDALTALAQTYVTTPPPQQQPGAPQIFVYPFKPYPGLPNTLANRLPVLALNDQWGSGQYERFVRERVVRAQGEGFTFQKKIANGGTALPIVGPVYKLLDVRTNAVVAIWTNPGGSPMSGVFYPQFPVTSGRALLQILPCDATGNPDPNALEQSVPHPVTLDLDGNAKNLTTVATCRSTEDWTRQAAHAVAIVPKSWLVGAANPWQWTPPVPFTATLPGSKVFRYILTGAPGEANMSQPHHLLTMKSGVQHSACMQGYFPRDMYAARPETPQINGERGEATAYFFLFGLNGRNGKKYVHSPVGWDLILGSGRRFTLFGKRHRYAPDWREVTHGGPEEELVGICTDPRVPPGEAYLRNSWGGDWDHDSLKLDPNGPQVGGEDPHNGDVVWFATDERGWVWRLRRNGRDPNRDKDPTTWEPTRGDLWITGLNLPRGCTHRRNTRELLVSEAAGHRITRWSMDQPQTLLGVVLEKTSTNNYGGYATVAQTDQNGAPRNWQGADPHSAAVQAEPILGPEWIGWYEDVDGEWCAWLSRAQLDARRINLGTGVRQKIGNLSYTNPQASPGYHVTQGCVVDNLYVDPQGHRPRGGFGPHGTVLSVDFFNGEYGRALALAPKNPTNLPDTAVSALTNGYFDWRFHDFGYDVIAGRGPKWSNDQYPTSVFVGYDEMTQCTSLDGVIVYRQATTADPSPDYARLTRGHNYYKSQGYDVLGLYGFVPNGWRPWGENADCDYWLEYHGHQRGA